MFWHGRDTHDEATYKEYLLSPEWLELRSERLGRDNYQCVFCGGTENLEVHHNFYPAYVEETDPRRDLETLCHECHQRKDGQRKKKFDRKIKREVTAPIVSAAVEQLEIVIPASCETPARPSAKRTREKGWRDDWGEWRMKMREDQKTVTLKWSLDADERLGHPENLNVTWDARRNFSSRWMFLHIGQGYKVQTAKNFRYVDLAVAKFPVLKNVKLPCCGRFIIEGVTPHIELEEVLR